MAVSEGLIILKQKARYQMLTVGARCATEYLAEYGGATPDQEGYRPFDPEDYPEFRAAKKVIELIEVIEES